MPNIIIATSIREQQEVMHYIVSRLKEIYLTETSVEILTSNMSTIKVLRTVNGVKHVAVSYHVLMVPVTMCLDNLRGFSHDTEFNITRLIERLDDLKKEAINFVANRKIVTKAERDKKVDFSKTVGKLFKGVH